jgi:predicted O-methyltransferase YrrM
MNNQKQKIESFFKDSESLDLLIKINNQIKERNFHYQTHILYDIANYLNKQNLNYLEIGSYVGSSAALMLENNNIKKVFCIDPLTLSQSHFKGNQDQEKTIRSNLSRFSNDRYCIHKGFSTDEKILNFFKTKRHFFDIIFIDGDHSYSGVLNDFNNFKGCLKKGGFLIFDDYYDFKYSPEVKKAVDDLCLLQSVKREFNIIGTPLGPLSQKLGREYGEFIMRKKDD